MSIRRFLVKKIKRLIKFKKLIGRSFSGAIDKVSLKNDLENIGVKQGMSLFVHSSLSSLGNIEGGPKTVIESLKLAVGLSGNISMPGFTIRQSFSNSLDYLSKQDVPYNNKEEEPLVGAIPRFFFHSKNVFRSLHPTHSVLSWGSKASFITRDHEKCDTTFGEGTPLYKLIESESYIMGLGSDLGHVTFYHVLEDVLDNFPIKIYEDAPYTIKLLTDDNKIIEKEIWAHCSQKYRVERISSMWLRNYFRDYFIENGGMKIGKIGDSMSWIIKASELYRCLEELLKKGITIYSSPSDKV